MNFPLRVYSRITLELSSPCAIGTGGESSAGDQPFMCDFNGLPTLPGTSLAGMLRAAFRRAAPDGESSGDARHDDWFGFARGEDGEASRVRLTWGHVHDEHDRPVEGLLGENEKSAFLQDISDGTRRDHVRISHLGTVDGAGKFARQVLATGVRFTFDLEIVGHRDDELSELIEVRDELIELLQSPATRLGGAKHSGMGGFFLVRVLSEAFDLRKADDFERFTQALPVRLDMLSCLKSLDIPAPTSAYTSQIECQLEPETFFLIGGGQSADPSPDAPKINPVRRPKIVWKNGRGSFSTGTLYLPATALKGALRHRVAFHYNRYAGHFAEPGEDFMAAVEAHTGEANGAVAELFGYCKNGDKDAQDTGAAGRIIIEDVELGEYEDFRRKLMHTSIDAFTGGVRGRMLFSEEALQPNGPAIKVNILVENTHSIDANMLRALHDAVEDLTSGRLSLGSGYGRGNGRFGGSFHWPESLKIEDGAAKIEEVVA